MAKIVIVCAILLGVLGTVQIVSMERSRKPYPPSPTLLPFGSGFSGFVRDTYNGVSQRESSRKVRLLGQLMSTTLGL
jgi:hypothetical protein